jgi:membrane-bound lytic murein transglycosylase D
VFLLLGACAHAPPQADPITHERISRIMLTMEKPDSLSHDIAIKASASVDTPAAASGIDRSAFELPVPHNQRVQEYIDLYVSRRRSTFTMWLRRMGRYREMIEAQLQSEGLPRELVYLPLIESAYEANAASHASAVGLWQFMAGTARSEGLEVSEYVDERRDPIRSTEAAIRHLSGLYNLFDSWYLTAAAYNSGSTRISRLLKERGYSKGHDDAFWQLQDALPKETRDYVPMLLAAAVVGENAEHYGITVEPDAPIRFDVVNVPGATELRAVARAAGATVEQINALNAHFIKGMTPPSRTSEVRIPPGAAQGFAAAFAKIPEAERIRPTTTTHVVKSGDTLSGIARKYGTTVEVITRMNAIKKPDALAIGRKLVIPVAVHAKLLAT